MPRADAVRNRAAVMSAAAELLERADSSEEVTMDAIARRAGVGKGTVFRAFGSREALLVALFETEAAAYFSSARDVGAAERNDPAARLLALLEDVLQAKRQHPVLFEALESIGRVPRQTHGYQQWHAMIVEALAAGGRGDQASYLADVFLGALRGNVTSSHSLETIRRSLDLLVTGLALRPSSSTDGEVP